MSGNFEASGPFDTNPGFPRAAQTALSRVSAMRHVSMGAGGTNVRSTNGVFTIGENWTVEDDYDYIRVGIYADQTTNPAGETAIGPIGYSQSASCVTGDPVDGNGNILPLTLFTFNNGGANLSPDQQMMAQFTSAKSNPTTFIPPNTAYAASGTTSIDGITYFSDWMPVKSISRTDGGAGRLLHLRSYLAATTAYVRGPLVPQTGISGYNQAPYPYAYTPPAYVPAQPCGNGKMLTNRDYQIWLYSGNFVSPQASLPAWSAAASYPGIGIIYTVEVVARNRALTVQAVGDSVLQGYGSSTGFDGFIARACAQASAIGAPVHHLNSAIYGAQTTNFLASAARDLNNYPIDAAVMEVWTSNDITAGMTPAQQQAAADAAFSVCLAYADIVQQRGGTPIFCTPPPQPYKCTTPAQDATRLSAVTRLQAMEQRGALVLDLNGLWGDGGSPVNYRAGLSPDQYHGLDVAQALAAAVLTPMLHQIAGR